MADEGIIDVFIAAGLKKKEVMVKCILKKHGYPPDLQEEATNTVLAQGGAAVSDMGIEQ